MREISANGADQQRRKKTGTERELNAFEIAQLGSNNMLPPWCVILSAPTATEEMYGEFSAIAGRNAGIPVFRCRSKLVSRSV